MTETGILSEAIEQVLPDIDRYFADQDVPVTERPLQAAIVFTTNFVLAVQDQGDPSTPPGAPGDFVVSRWFAMLYADVAAWYEKRFPGVMGQQHDDRISGVVMIAGTAFSIRVPAVRMRPGNSEDTIWISFPDGLRDGEHALDWIETPPDFTTLPPRERSEAEDATTAVAGTLRFIRTGLLAVRDGDAKLDGMKGGIMPRLKRAAELLLDRDSRAVQYAYWELQLACEMALKSLSQQRTGTFRETHDLFLLYDDLGSQPPDFSRDLLKRLPRSGEMSQLRYGQGTRQSRAECVSCYRNALAVVAGSVRSMERLGIGAAEFEIGRLPWMAISQ